MSPGSEPEVVGASAALTGPDRTLPLASNAAWLAAHTSKSARPAAHTRDKHFSLEAIRDCGKHHTDLCHANTLASKGRNITAGTSKSQDGEP